MSEKDRKIATVAIVVLVFLCATARTIASPSLCWTVVSVWFGVTLIGALLGKWPV